MSVNSLTEGNEPKKTSDVPEQDRASSAIVSVVTEPVNNMKCEQELVPHGVITPEESEVVMHFSNEQEERRYFRVGKHKSQASPCVKLTKLVTNYAVVYEEWQRVNHTASTHKSWFRCRRHGKCRRKNGIRHVAEHGESNVLCMFAMLGYISPIMRAQVGSENPKRLQSIYTVGVRLAT